MEFLSIDFETATACRDSACAVGIALVANSVIVDSASYLIQPPGNRYDGYNVRIHGITPEMTANAESFIPVMNSILASSDGLPLIAHNASFDMSVLRACFESNGYGYPQRDYYCTLLMARSAFPELPDHRLPRVLNACGGTMRQHHDPRCDAEACAEIALAIAGSHEATTLEVLRERIGMRVGHLYEYEYRPCRCSTGSASRGSSKKPMSDYACNQDADASGAFYDADVVFTGAMASMSRDAAMQVVAERGGRPRTSVSRLTEYVVLGQLDHEAFTQGNPSRKLKTALDLVEAGHSIQVLSEKEFLELLQEAAPAPREYAADHAVSDGNQMEASWHFGYNCNNYLPTLHKCRVLVDMYSQRADLLREKWLTSLELLVYTGAPPDELLLKVESGSIRVKRQKSDGSLRFRVQAPWEWDGCPLKDSGGQCLHYEPHTGRHISCLMDLEDSTWEHPGKLVIPSSDAVVAFEAAADVQ